MARHSFFVFSNPQSGQEAAYNEWYDKVHLPEVLAIPGFISAQRYRLSDAQGTGGAPSSRNYLAIYEIETDDLAAMIADLESRTDTMVLTDAINPDVSLQYFTPYGPRQHAK